MAWSWRNIRWIYSKSILKDMKLNKTQKLYGHMFDKIISGEAGEQFLKDFKATYYYKKISNVISDSDIMVHYYPKNKSKLRITFPLFLICILLINIFMCFNWLFTGNIYIKKEWKIAKLMIARDRYCRFNVI